jgi:hypothetical protein
LEKKIKEEMKMFWHNPFPSPTKRFAEVYPNYQIFLGMYHDVWGSLLPPQVDDNDMRFIYNILMSKYAPVRIAFQSEDQFNLALMGEVYQFAPLFVFKKKANDEIKTMTLDFITDGGTTIVNAALNQSTPMVNTLDGEGLEQIDNQTVQLQNAGKFQAYMQRLRALNDNFFDEYFDKFRKLFANVMLEKPVWFDISNPNEDDKPDDDVIYLLTVDGMNLLTSDGYFLTVKKGGL